MAWSKAEKDLYNVLSLDIDGWDEMPNPSRMAIVVWILEDRRQPANKKAERIIAKLKSSLEQSRSAYRDSLGLAS